MAPKAKPIRRVTTDWLGGPYRHACTHKDAVRSGPTTDELEGARRLALRLQVKETLRASNGLTAAQLASQLNSSIAAVTRAIKALGGVIEREYTHHGKRKGLNPSPTYHFATRLQAAS